ncbi:MAG TPA: flippase activity-associated protein Agl23 [Anaerolineales bacterium]|nr:flippase activity-associated protein Agl23 [Anaerolineales bacterium]
MPKEQAAHQPTWLDQPFFPNLRLTWETGLVALLLLAAVLTRFSGLGDRAMSHDETTHVVFSWQLYQGDGYLHDPLSHGPLQFHLLALSYFLFGDNDFTARAPAALFSVFTVFFVWWAFRRYLGRIGALLAATFFLISPYMLYYGRYARNESWVALFGLVMLWGILRYLDRGENKYLYVTTASLALHFAAKETSFIYSAQALIFLGLLFLFRIATQKWRDKNGRRTFLIVFMLGASLLLLALGARAIGSAGGPGTVSASEVAEPAVPVEGQEAAPTVATNPIPLALGAAGLVALGASVYFLGRGYGWQRVRAERSFGLMALIFALVLPSLGAFLLNVLAPTLTYSYFRNVVSTANWSTLFGSPDFPNILLLVLVMVFMFVLSAAIGALWNIKQWLINMGIFFPIFLPLFTTMFTNSLGLFTGLVGSLGYWTEQQAVERGSQPWYYYWAVQIPVYEYLAAVGSLLAAGLGIAIWRRDRREKRKPKTEDENRKLRPEESRRLALALLAFWALASLGAYTVAGEKMPWLSVHIALPMLLLAGWALGWMIKHVNWEQAAKPRSLFVIASMAVAILAALDLISILLGRQFPFRGMEQAQLQATLRFVFTAILLSVSVVTLFMLKSRNKWKAEQLRRVFVVLVFAGLALLTTRTAFRAAYVNYDLATEYLVYAHMARGPKEMMEQLEELSLRLTDGLDIRVAYDNETNYPLWWYLRNYPNKIYYDQDPSASLREAPVIIVGDANYSKIEPVVRDDYYLFEFVRIWWPNQDYFDFTESNIGSTFSSETGLSQTQMNDFDYWGRVVRRMIEYVDTAEEREALFQVWFNRDFSDYLTLKGQDPSLAKWNPSRSMRMYVRKDVAAQIWDFGVQPVAVEPDPYAGKGIELTADLVVGGAGSAEGLFSSPRGLAAAPDGSLFVADSFNHRIQHLAPDGTFLDAWGTQSDPSVPENPGGSFSEPWGVTVSPDGRYVYVADTWNHRVQKFTSSGTFITMWGIFANDNQPTSLYGPRDLVVAADGNVLVTDTGNKRIVVYDAAGNFLSQIGGAGFELGQFEEPVGLALDREAGLLYVADTWNQRIQVLTYADGLLSTVTSWEVDAWFGQSLNNKPYLAVGGDGRVYASDPETGRVLVFQADGELLNFFGGYDQSVVEIGLAQGLATDGQGGLWLSDSQNNRVLHFVTE